jgi:4-amino-4-deoxy-L-arabinose transferase-like glycosyltransferase
VTSHRRAASILLALGLALRIAVALNAGPHLEPETDALSYDIHATNVAETGLLGNTTVPGMEGPTAFRAPAYPYLLGAVYAVFGDHSYTEALHVNALLGTAAVALLGYVAVALLGRRVGLVVMGLAAVHPILLLNGATLQVEPLLSVLTLGSLAAAVHHRLHPDALPAAILAGALGGLAILTREQSAVYLLTAVVLLWSPARDDVRRSRRWRAPAVAGAAALLTVAPWTIRNLVVLDEVVPVTTATGFGLVGTYNETAVDDPAHLGLWMSPYQDPRALEVILTVDDPKEPAVDAALRDYALETVRSHPGYVGEVALGNLVRGFDLDGGAYSRYLGRYLPYPPGLVMPAVAAGWVTLVGALVAIGTPLTRRIPTAVWIAPLALLAITLVTVPLSIRYRVLLLPFELLLAACTVNAIAGRARRRSRPPQPSYG